MTDTKEKRPEKILIDPTLALGPISSVMKRHRGLNIDSLGWLSMLERIRMSGNGGAVASEEQAGVTHLLINTEEAEKKRIARELHDGLGQLLTSINLQVQQCLDTSNLSQEVPPELKNSLEVISSMAKQAMGEVRGICCALRPAILDDLGVLAAINWQCRQITQADERLNVTTDYGVHEAMIPDEYKTTIYRIVQEALNNTVKYAKAENLRVKLCQAGDFLQLLIHDDGVGFQVSDDRAGSGMGLISMRERAESIGGTFELHSGEGRGVEIQVLLPFEKVALSG